jgi:hypothetical protein
MPDRHLCLPDMPDAIGPRADKYAMSTGTCGGTKWGWATPAGGAALRDAGPKRSNGLRMPPNSDSGPSHDLALSLTASCSGCKLAYTLSLTSNLLSSKPQNAQRMLSCVLVHLGIR